jgi:hypothetical protein
MSATTGYWDAAVDAFEERGKAARDAFYALVRTTKAMTPKETRGFLAAVLGYEVDGDDAACEPVRGVGVLADGATVSIRFMRERPADERGGEEKHWVALLDVPAARPIAADETMHFTFVDGRGDEAVLPWPGARSPRS